MMTGSLKPWLLFTLGLCLFLGLDARAENDYAFAERLLDVEKQSSNFQTEDLVERLIGKLEGSGSKDSKLEGRLIRAMLLRKQVTGASAERKKELLDEADRIYKEFVKDGQNHPLLAECRKAADEIQLEFVRVLIDTAKADPGGGADSHKKAVDILKGIKLQQKEAVEKAWPALVDAYKEYQKYIEAHPMEAEVPANLMNKIGAAVEKVVVTDQHYIQTWLMQVDAYSDNDAEKKREADELGKFCRVRVDSEQLSEFGLACAFYLYSKGRAHSYVLDEKNASECWREALGLLPDEAAADEGTIPTIRALQRMIIFDLVQMKMKAGEKEAAKYEEVISLVRQIKISPSLKWILEEPTGKQMLIDYGYALIRQPESSAVEVGEAIKALRDVVASGPPWSYMASQAMAKILSEAGQKKRPRLNAAEWFDTARGFFYQGQQAYKRYEEYKQGGNEDKASEEHAEAVGHYEQAVEYYRRAIALARNPEVTDAVTRLTIEPDAWFEMGLSYQKMDQLLEAAVAYKALRSAFDKDARERWLPKKFDVKTQAAAAKKLVAELDKEDARDEGLLKRSSRNIVIALNKLPPTSSNKRLKERLLESGDILGEFGGDMDYDKGKLALVDAKGFEEQAATQLKNKRPEEVAKNLAQTYQRYTDAAKAFSEVKTSSQLYEIALYQTGSAYVLAQVLLVEKIARSGKMTDEEVDAQAKELADKGLKALQSYEDYVAKTHNPAQEVVARREKLSKLVMLSRTTLTYAAGQMDECIKACDDYLKVYAADLKDSPDDSKLLAVVFNKFRAMSKVGGDKAPPECDPYLVEAGKLLQALRVKDAYYRYALGNLSARYYNASVRAEKAQMDVQRVREYDRKLAEYMTKALRLKPEQERDLDDYGRLLGTLEKIQDYVAAADIAEEMLKLFDPEGKNCRRADEEWPIILKRVQDSIRYPDLQKMETCRNDHAVLVDYLYEEDRNIDMEVDARPKHDKYPVDFNKAQLQIETIRKNYPKCASLDPQEGVDGKCWLDIIKDEIDYRQRIVATRQLLADAAIAAADAVEKENPERAVQYRTTADQQLSILLGIIGNVPAMKLKQGELRVANRDYQGALRILYEVKNGESRNNSSELYVKTSIMVSKVYQLMGDGKSAAEYAHFLISTAGRKSRVVEKHWPDIDEFLQWCYQNGATPLKEIKVDTAYDYKPKTPDETEFAEVVEPAYREAARNGVEKVLPSVKWRYDFLKAKIEHWSEFVKLDRAIQMFKGKPNEKEVLNENFMTRYQTLETLHAKEGELSKLSRRLDEAIVREGSFDKVVAKQKELVENRDRTTAEIAELTKKLANLPEVVLPKVEAGGEDTRGTLPEVKKEDGSANESSSGAAQSAEPRPEKAKPGAGAKDENSEEAKRKE